MKLLAWVSSFFMQMCERETWSLVGALSCKVGSISCEWSAVRKKKRVWEAFPVKMEHCGKKVGSISCANGALWGEKGVESISCENGALWEEKKVWEVFPVKMKHCGKRWEAFPVKMEHCEKRKVGSISCENGVLWEKVGSVSCETGALSKEEFCLDGALWKRFKQQYILSHWDKSCLLQETAWRTPVTALSKKLMPWRPQFSVQRVCVACVGD